MLTVSMTFHSQYQGDQRSQECLLLFTFLQLYTWLHGVLLKHHVSSIRIETKSLRKQNSVEEATYASHIFFTLFFAAREGRHQCHRTTDDSTP
jgi:hypothetical protein